MPTIPIIGGLRELLDEAIATERPEGIAFDVINPADSTVIATLRSHTVESSREAIRRASCAFDAWRYSLPLERSQILRRWANSLRQDGEILAAVLTAEQGKPLHEAKAEVLYAASYFDWFAEESRRAYGQLIPPHASDKRLTVVQEPVGVCAAVTPWNFPLAMAARKIAPALAAGCTMLVKPSEFTPLSALLMTLLGYRSGVPRDVLITLAADEPHGIGIVKLLCESTSVRKLSFTGSTRVGQILMAQCASTVKKLSLELGGNAPFIVFDDADLEAAVDGAMQSKFRNAGQTCVCANRFLVHANILPAFVERLAEEAGRLKVGPGCDEATDIGPLIHTSATARVQQLVQDAEAQGAVRVGRTATSVTADGRFVIPMVLTGVTADMRIAKDEIFGPVAAIQTFKTEAEAVALANDTPYGLAAYFYSEDVHRCHRVSQALDCGMVGINTGLISTEVAPFGGTKQSGFGREGGNAGLSEYLNMKYVCSGVRASEAA